MIPPWDSLEGLRDYQDWLTRVAMIVGVIWGMLFVIGGGLWGWFQYSLTNRIDVLAEKKEKAARAPQSFFSLELPKIAEFVAGQSVKYGYSIRNAGPNPGRVVRIASAFFLCDRMDKQSIAQKMNDLRKEILKRPTELPTVLAAGESYEVTKPPTTEPLSKDDEDAIINRTKAPHIGVVAEVREATGHESTIWACFQYRISDDRWTRIDEFSSE